MKVCILVEGQPEKDLLEKLLADLLSRSTYKIEAASSKDAARPIVRKHLLRVGEPTAFVFDTDTTDRPKIRAQLRAFEDYFGWGSRGVPFAMFPMVPAMEVLFFERPRALERRLGTPLDPATKRAGAHAPKQVLEGLMPSIGAASLDEFVRSLTPEEIADLREQETIVKLRSFVEGVSELPRRVG